jgi:hypothetical protein
MATAASSPYWAITDVDGKASELCRGDHILRKLIAHFNRTVGLSEPQVHFTRMAITSWIPQIFGDDFGAHKQRIQKMYGISDFRDAFISTAPTPEANATPQVAQPSRARLTEDMLAQARASKLDLGTKAVRVIATMSSLEDGTPPELGSWLYAMRHFVRLYDDAKERGGTCPNIDDQKQLDPRTPEWLGWCGMRDFHSTDECNRHRLVDIHSICPVPIRASRTTWIRERSLVVSFLLLALVHYEDRRYVEFTKCDATEIQEGAYDRYQLLLCRVIHSTPAEMLNAVFEYPIHGVRQYVSIFKLAVSMRRVFAVQMMLSRSVPVDHFDFLCDPNDRTSLAESAHDWVQDAVMPGTAPRTAHTITLVRSELIKLEMRKNHYYRALPRELEIALTEFLYPDLLAIVVAYAGRIPTPSG